MHILLNGTSLLVIVLFTGCASMGQHGQRLEKISYADASAFENSLRSKEKPSIPILEELFTQPVNKKEPCKIPTSQDQLDRNNFRAYWDGQCRNGFAYGLGRDIAISDTHHVEEITVHNGERDDYSAPAILYDYVNNEVTYSVRGEKFPEGIWMVQYFKNNSGSFHTAFRVRKIDKLGNTLIIDSSPLNPELTLYNYDTQVVYKFMESSAPIVDPLQVVSTAEILDPKTDIAGGVKIVFNGNRQVHHLQLLGTQQKEVSLPAEYIALLKDKYAAVKIMGTTANANVEPARKIEREYLYMACNGKHSIDGLDNNIATKICTWRNQFETPYRESLVKYNEIIEQMKQRAVVVEQQRKLQEQLAIQQNNRREQESKEAVGDLLNTLSGALGQVSQQLQTSTDQIQKSYTSFPSPQITPMRLPGSNNIRCLNTGSITNCRY